MPDLISIDTSLATHVAGLLISRQQTLAISESSTGGLISASLLAVPGASAFFLGGSVTYTGKARETLLGVTPAMTAGMRSATQEMAYLLARTVRERLGNRYGDAAGHCCLAIVGPHETAHVLETGCSDRSANMVTFANAALALLEQAMANQ
jgi:nicotinamide-nucleotide amidase